MSENGAGLGCTTCSVFVVMLTTLETKISFCTGAGVAGRLHLPENLAPGLSATNERFQTCRLAPGTRCRHLVSRVRPCVQRRHMALLPHPNPPEANATQLRSCKRGTDESG